MSASDRREALARIAFLGLAPLGWGLASGATAQATPRLAPQGRFLLTRRLERQLGAVDTLVVTRGWQCDFHQGDTCIAVTGHQTMCEVQAPAMLGPLAEAERARVSALFPLELDATGAICAETPTAPDDSLQAAADAARAILKDAAPGSRGFLATLTQTASHLVSVVPADLFFPHDAGAHFEQTVPLGAEGDGSIVVSTMAQVRGDGLLVASARHVTTTLAGVSRHASESWTLAPISA